MELSKDDATMQDMADQHSHLPLEPKRFLTNGAPDRLSVEPSSPFFNLEAIKKVRVTFNGIVQTKVVEYCVSEGWVRRHVQKGGKLRLSRNGSAIAFKAQGNVEVSFDGLKWCGKDDLRPTD